MQRHVNCMHTMQSVINKCAIHVGELSPVTLRYIHHARHCLEILYISQSHFPLVHSLVWNLNNDSIPLYPSHSRGFVNWLSSQLKLICCDCSMLKLLCSTLTCLRSCSCRSILRPGDIPIFEQVVTELWPVSLLAEDCLARLMVSAQIRLR